MTNATETTLGNQQLKAADRRSEIALAITLALVVAGDWLLFWRPGGLSVFLFRRGAQQSPLIRGLVYAWIAQNILLCISSIRRLELYVETYSLNVSHSQRLGGPQPLDLAYLRELGPTTIPAIDRYVAALPQGSAADAAAREMRASLADGFTSRERDWRSWGYRDWRLGQYLAGQPSAPIASGH